MKRELTTQQLKKKLWKIFSEYIRRSHADWQGMVTCVTCGKYMHWKEADAGHYHPRTDGLAMFFEEKNVHPQCNPCNRWRHGNLTKYALYLRKRYGEQILEELEWKQKQGTEIKYLDYLRLIEFYKNKLLEL